MDYTVGSYRMLSMLRYIPEETLLGIVQYPDFARVIIETHAPLPESVFTHLYAEYGDFEDNAERLFARALTLAERAVIFAAESSPQVLQPVFKYNTLTHPELVSLTKHVVSGTAVIDLLRNHRKDSTALAIISELLPKDLVKNIKKAAYRYSSAPATISGAGNTITVEELPLYLGNDKPSLHETHNSMFTHYPLHTPLESVWRSVARSRGSGGRPKYDADPLTQLLGTNAFIWVAFLRMLDSAPTEVTAAKIAATVLRSRVWDRPVAPMALA